MGPFLIYFSYLGFFGSHLINNDLWIFFYEHQQIYELQFEAF